MKFYIELRIEYNNQEKELKGKQSLFSLPKIQLVSKRGLSMSEGSTSDWGGVEARRFRSKPES